MTAYKSAKAVLSNQTSIATSRTRIALQAKMLLMGSSISANAQRICQLQQRINETLTKMPHGPEHHAACADFQREYDSLAFPGGLKAGLERLKNPDPEITATAVDFLEIDPRFFRSGYIKETILRRLKHCPLTAQQQIRIGQLIVRYLDRGGRREFKGYSRLVRTIHPPFLLEAVQVRMTSADPESARRAAAIQHILDSNHLPRSH